MLETVHVLGDFQVNCNCNTEITLPVPLMILTLYIPMLELRCPTRYGVRY